MISWLVATNQVAGYKINLWKSLEFLHTNNEVSKKEAKKAIPFITASKIIK